jgi:hypothetical protein
MGIVVILTYSVFGISLGCVLGSHFTGQGGGNEHNQC